MDFALLPQVSVVGRVANRFKLRHTRGGSRYVHLLIYMYHDKHAKLMPMIAFNKVASKIAGQVNQGDLLLLQSRIDPLQNGRFINPTIIVSEFSHLESKTIRNVYNGRKGKELKALFPITPENYQRVRNRNNRRTRKTRKHKQRKLKKPVKVEKSKVTVLPRKRSKKADGKHLAHDPFSSGNWVKKAEDLTDFHFPGLH